MKPIHLFMKLVIKLFTILLLLAGISLLITPEFIIDWIEANTENTSLYISAIVVRFIFGVLFIVAAKESAYPMVIKIFGYMFIIAAIVFLLMGQESFQHLMTSLIPRFKPFAPVSGILSIAFGGFLIYAFSKKKVVEQH